MKRNIITALLITAMISTMTACGNKNTDATTETVTTTETAVTATEETITTEVATQDQIATLPLTDEDNPVVDATPSPEPKASDAPKTTADPKASTKPVVTATTKPGTQTASVTATTKPVATEKPQSTTAPKATATPAPKATETPKATPAPTAAPVACQHTNTHIENAHDTYQVPISGGCYEEWETVTRVCNDCGANLGESKNRVGDVHHGCVITEGVSATCTTDGRTTVWGCDCGGSGTTGGDVIPAFGHDYKDEWDHDETDAEGKDHVYFHSICRNCGDISSVWEE